MAHASSLKKQMTSPASAPGVVAQGPEASRWIKTFGTPIRRAARDLLRRCRPDSPEDYQVVANYPAHNTAICSYPNVWPHDASGAVNSYSQITSSFNESFPHNAQTAAHAMFDLWFNNWSYEVMVQYDFSNDGACEGSWPEVKTNVTFGGTDGVPSQAWHLCTGNGGKSLVWKLGAADGAQEQSESSGTVDLLPMLKYLERKGYLPANAKWTAISMGWEIASTGGKSETFSGSGFTVDMVPGSSNRTHTIRSARSRAWAERSRSEDPSEWHRSSDGKGAIRHFCPMCRPRWAGDKHRGRPALQFRRSPST